MPRNSKMEKMMKILNSFIALLLISSYAGSQPLEIEIQTDSSISAIDYPAFVVKIKNSTSAPIYILGDFEKFDIEYHFLANDTKRHSRGEMLLDTSKRIYSNRIGAGSTFEYGIIDRFFDLNARRCKYSYIGKVRAKITFDYYYNEEWNKATKTVEFNLRKPNDEELQICEKLRRIATEVDPLLVADELIEEFKDGNALVNRTFSVFVSARIRGHRQLKKHGRIKYDKQWLKFARLYGSAGYLFSVREAIAHFHFKYRNAARTFDLESMPE